MQERTFDYVIIGGGSAGCVMASRLSEETSQTVCLLEAGKPDSSVLIQAPAGVAAMMPTKINNWAFQTIPQPGLNGRKGYQPRGKTLGGSSSLNAMMYARGHRWDYDHWASLGNDGWSYDEILPYFKKAENNENITSEYHGKGGPLNVANLVSPSAMNDVFLKACEENGIPQNPDVNGAEQFGAMTTQVTQKNGERCSTAKAYLTPNLGRQNLEVITSATTSRILFEGNTAVGVEYLKDGQKLVVKANKEVILSAGAFGSPQILKLSGIGNREELQEHGIDVVHHLPGVGENLQDHIDLVHTFRTKSSKETFGLSAPGGIHMAKAMHEWSSKRTGKITSNFGEGIGFVKSEPDLDVPDMELVFVVGIVDDHNRKLHLGHGYSCHVTLLRPKSRGWVRLNSTDPTDGPKINPAFFDDPDDMTQMVKGWKLQHQVLMSKAFDPYRGKNLYPVDINDDEAIIQDLRNRADTQYHPVGTCKMGTDDDEMAVVDNQLRVRGLKGLRVIDASIMPTLVGGNTNAPTVMIAEKAADMIRKERQIEDREEQAAEV